MTTKRGFFDCPSLNNSNCSIEIDENNPYFKMDGNCIISKQDNKLVQGFINSVIPDYVKVIGKEAFKGVGLTTLTLPSTVEVIEENAFASNKIKGWSLEPNSAEIYREAIYDNDTKLYQTTSLLSEMEKYLENMKLPDDTVFYVVYEKDGGLVQT